jgi:hopene-associated glycosyltransferase HpnB
MTILAMLALAAWAYLLLGRGGFWRARPRIEDEAAMAPAPAVVAVVPARNEAEGIGPCLRSLFAQDYPGDFRIVLVDDGSTDGTADIARQAAREAKAESRIEIARGRPLPAGWTGKLWAVAQGVNRAEASGPEFLWLTDADIEHDASELRRLVGIASDKSRDLVSLMVLLRCESFWEYLLIPAFVFFFQMLYPFPWANDERKSVAAAAGGSMLVRRNALKGAGGIAAIKSEVIDDCALAAAIKKRGKIWIGLTAATRSLRRYETLAEIWNMVARSAYTQLRHSPRLLAGTVAGMIVIFAVPLIAVAVSAWWPSAGALYAFGFGAAAYLAMAVAFRPTLRLYGLPALSVLLLPAAALLYCAMTVDSARRHMNGQGGGWKGRHYGPGPVADET